MNRIQTITGITALVIGLSGCPLKNNSTPTEKVTSMREYYQIGNSATSLYPEVKTIEGSIVKVQPSNISFKVNDGNATRNDGREFIYVVLQENNGTLHTLLYPQSKAILERQAIIQYRGVPNGKINASTFIYLFVERAEKEYATDDNILIEAEGIITPEGIKYR